MSKKNKVLTASIPPEMDTFICELRDKMSKKANINISKSQVVVLMLNIAIDVMAHSQEQHEKEENEEHGC